MAGLYKNNKYLTKGREKKRVGIYCGDVFLVVMTFLVSFFGQVSSLLLFPPPLSYKIKSPKSHSKKYNKNFITKNGRETATSLGRAQEYKKYSY